MVRSPLIRAVAVAHSNDRGLNMTRLFTTLLSATAMTALAPAVQAQTAPAAAVPVQTADASNVEDEGSIIVTGTRIRGGDLTAAGPVTTIGAEEIANTGQVNLENILQRLPASAGFGGNQTSAYWTGRGWGTAQVNLRGLGINRTLMLMNGRRLVNGGTGANTSPDLNMIPVAALERVDVLKDGASAIYGTDAVAGVVNLITRQNYEGIGLGARMGITGRGDGEDFTLDGSIGVQSDRGGIALFATFQDTSPINMATRAPCGLGEVGGVLTCVNSASTAGGRATLPNGQQINFNNVPGGNGNFYEPYSAAKHNYNGNPSLNAVNQIQRLSTALFAHYDLGAGVEMFAEGLFTHRETQQLATPGTLRNLAISASNPTNPTGQNITLVQRRLIETGSRTAFQETDTYQITGGLRGDLGRDWHWEVAGSWGRNTGIDGFTNVANLERVGNTLNLSRCSFTAGAAIPCADYLGAGDVTPAVVNYITFTSRDTGGNELLSLTADITGQWFELPGGTLGVAAGISYREDSGWRNPDPLTVLGIANTNQQSPISGTLKASEAYFEASAPLLADLPFIEQLTVNGAVRYSDYNLFGGTWNYKFGGDWRIGGGFGLRGTYGTAFRAPSVPELFGGVSQGNLTTTDPCSNYSSSTNATLKANCVTSGVPAGYVQLGNSILTNTGGNVNLEPETAKTLTLGAIYQPQFARGLILTVDYFNIKIEDGIRAIPGSTKLSLCYNTPNFAQPFCTPQDFTRNRLTGEVDFLSSQLINVGEEEVRGFDFGANYGGKIGSLDAMVNVNVTYLDKYEIRNYSGAAPVVYDGRIGGGNGSYSQWRGYGVLSLGRNGVTGTWSTQWIGGAQDFNALPTQIGYKTSSVFYHNIQLAVDLPEGPRLSFGVDNLFDQKSPFIRSYTDGNTDTMTYDLSWRRLYVTVRYDFR